MWLLRRAVLLISVFACLFYAQEQAPAPDEPKLEFISGTVTDLPPGRIVVNRAVPGKPEESRAFLILPETKVEGRLRVRARVTVGFRTSDEGDVAMRIIVRSQRQ